MSSMVISLLFAFREVPDKLRLDQNLSDKTRRVTYDAECQVKAELKVDPTWADYSAAVSADIGTARRSLRSKKTISYVEEEIPDVDLFLFCDVCQVKSDSRDISLPAV